MNDHCLGPVCTAVLHRIILKLMWTLFELSKLKTIIFVFKQTVETFDSICRTTFVTCILSALL